MLFHERGWKYNGFYNVVVEQAYVIHYTSFERENCSWIELKELHAKWATWTLSPTYQVKEGLLYCKDCFYIGSDSSLKDPLLEEFHASYVADHGGVKNTLVRMSQLFFSHRCDKMWRDLSIDEQFASFSWEYNYVKFSTQAIAGLLQPLPSLTNVCDELTMDFIVELPVSRGNTIILVVVDWLENTRSLVLFLHTTKLQKLSRYLWTSLLSILGTLVW